LLAIVEERFRGHPELHFSEGSVFFSEFDAFLLTRGQKQETQVFGGLFRPVR